MRVDVERVREWKEEIRIINEKNLDDIDIYENGVKLDISKKARDEFAYYGLNNITFITSNEYKTLAE